MGSIAWAHKYKLAPTPSYKVSKAALNMLNTVYALEYADAGFTFLLVSPGVRVLLIPERADRMTVCAQC
jgi:NAD(P)-dependent dehydrogenase (short-subunit alcohol dehydrogenase family)